MPFTRGYQLVPNAVRTQHLNMLDAIVKVHTSHETPSFVDDPAGGSKKASQRQAKPRM